MVYAIMGLLMLPVVASASFFLFLLGLGGIIREVEKAEQEDEET